jgi:hypothetical protein
VLLPLVIALNGLGPISPWGLIGGGFVARLLLVNIVLVLFNLIPAFPMDGGRVLRSILAILVADYMTATRWAVRVGQVVAGLLGIAAVLLLQNPMLMLIAVFVFFAAETELRQAMQDRLGPDRPVASFHRFDTVPAQWIDHPAPRGDRVADSSARRDPAVVTLVPWPNHWPVVPRD